MKILCSDVENTGLFRYDRRADAEGQPRMIELSTYLVELTESGRYANGDDYGNKPPSGGFPGFVYQIQPDGWQMDDELAEKLGHGLTHARLLEIGVPVQHALAGYMGLYEQADLIIGYNVAFDQKQLRAEFRRAGMPDLYGLKPEFDVMRACKPYSGATDKNGRPKNPKLGEAVKMLLGREHVGAHSAEADCLATVDLYFYLKHRGVDVSGKTPESKLMDEHPGTKTSFLD